MGKMIERWHVCVIQHKRRDRNRAFANRSDISIRLDAFDEMLLVEPIILAAARIGAGLQ